jgi:hypothetical protein
MEFTKEKIEECIQTREIPNCLDQIKRVLAHYNYTSNKSRTWARGLDADVIEYIDKLRLKRNSMQKYENEKKRKAANPDEFNEKSKQSTAVSYAKRVKNDPEYRAMRATKEKERRARLKEEGVSLSQKRKETDGGIWNNVLTSARQKNLKLSMTREQVITIAKQTCHYCSKGIKNKHGVFEARGLDRKDNALGYDGNSLPACTLCNYMKNDTEYEYFLCLCARLVLIWSGVDVTTEGMTFGASSRKTYKSFTNKKHKDSVEITEDEFNEIIRKPCYICKVDPSNGIDREDSNITYTAMNSNPCCLVCNYMKKTSTIIELKKKVYEIALVHPREHAYHGGTYILGIYRNITSSDCELVRFENTPPKRVEASDTLPITKKICHTCKLDKNIDCYDEICDEECKVCKKLNKINVMK